MSAANQQMQETRDYLARGRRFANLDADALNDYWIAAFHELHHRDPVHERKYNDLTAEFELRKVDLPYEQVKRIFEANLADAKRQLNSETFSARELEEKIEELLILALASYNKSNEGEVHFKEAS